MGIRDWEEESFGNPIDPHIQKIRKYVKGHIGADKDIEEQWGSHDERYMPKLYLARHGECDCSGKRVLGDADRPLTDNGIKEAWAAADKLKDKHIDKIYSSPLQRALMTAQIIAEYHPGLEVVIVKEFKERCHGILQGTPREEIPNYFEIDNSYRLKFPGGESTEEVGARVIPKLQEILSKDAGKDILIVSHSNVMKNMHYYLTKCPIEEMVKLDIKKGGIYEYALK